MESSDDSESFNDLVDKYIQSYHDRTDEGIWTEVKYRLIIRISGLDEIVAINAPWEIAIGMVSFLERLYDAIKRMREQIPLHYYEVEDPEIEWVKNNLITQELHEEFENLNKLDFVNANKHFGQEVDSTWYYDREYDEENALTLFLFTKVVEVYDKFFEMETIGVPDEEWLRSKDNANILIKSASKI